MKIRKGELICLIGDVGSGKSSIFSAINGDMIYVPNNVLYDNKDNLHSDDFFEKLESKLLT